MSISKNRTVAIIPARLDSSRLPRKPLVDIEGLPMIIHVFQRSLMASALDEVYVATDSREIAQVVRSYGGKVLMTRSDHETGTDRIAEAAAALDCEIVVNIQGDEALVRPEHINTVVYAMQSDEQIQVALLVNPYHKYNSPGDIKTVVNEQMEVMYFSRADIPSTARTPAPPMLKAYHIVPFRKPFLLQFAQWEKGKLERIEFIEYMRILEKGYRIKAVQVESSAVSVDTLEDLRFVREQMKHDSLFVAYQRIKPSA